MWGLPLASQKPEMGLSSQAVVAHWVGPLRAAGLQVPLAPGLTQLVLQLTGSGLMQSASLVQALAPPVLVLPAVAAVPPKEELPPVAAAVVAEHPPLELIPPTEVPPPGALFPPVDVGVVLVDVPALEVPPPGTLVPPEVVAVALAEVPPLGGAPPVALVPPDVELDCWLAPPLDGAPLVDQVLPVDEPPPANEATAVDEVPPVDGAPPTDVSPPLLGFPPVVLPVSMPASSPLTTVAENDEQPARARMDAEMMTDRIRMAKYSLPSLATWSLAQFRDWAGNSARNWTFGVDPVGIGCRPPGVANLVEFRDRSTPAVVGLSVTYRTWAARGDWARGQRVH